MQHDEEYVLGVLQDGGLLTRNQIDGARSRLNGEPVVLEILINDGALSDVDISRTLAAQAHIEWIDLSTMIIPPLINQYLNLIKNSSLAIAVGYPDLFNISQTIGNQTGQNIQVIALVMATYLVISLIVSAIMNVANQRMQIVER